MIRKLFLITVLLAVMLVVSGCFTPTPTVTPTPVPTVTPTPKPTITPTPNPGVVPAEYDAALGAYVVEGASNDEDAATTLVMNIDVYTSGHKGIIVDPSLWYSENVQLQNSSRYIATYRVYGSYVYWDEYPRKSHSVIIDMYELDTDDGPVFHIVSATKDGNINLMPWKK